jgi:hypothetical protein
MKFKEIPFKCVYKDVEIEGYAVFEDDYVEYFYYHPLTGQACRSIEQILIGWAEQDSNLNEQWKKLVEFARNDSILREWVESAENELVLAKYDDNGIGTYKYIY